MTSSPAERLPHAAQVAEHLEWVRRLARGLVRDPEAADDLAQDTILAALHDRGERPDSLRNWLAAVLRRIAADRVRRHHRSRDRERQVARPERAASHLEELERGSITAVVAEEVRALSPPYRDVLLWRYFEELTPTQIAERHGTPVATVKTRLQRALAQLRERLDARFGGDGRSWVAALAPLVAPPRAAPAAGALLAGGLVAVAFVVGAAWMWHPPAGTNELELPGGDADLALEASRDAGLGGRTERARIDAEARESGASAAATPARVESIPRLPEVVTGRVVDAAGAPAAGVPVVLEAAQTRGARGTFVAVSDDAGEFELRGELRDGLVRSLASGWTTVRAARLRGGERRELVVVVAPRRAIAGVVVNPDGAPIAGARLEWRGPPALAEADGVPLPLVFDGDAGGRFVVEDLPAVSGATLVVTRSGYRPETLPLPDDDRRDLRVALSPSAPEQRLEGRVELPNGAPAPNARVALDSEEVESDDAGRFRIDLPATGDGPWVVRALVAGHRPAALEVARGARRPLVAGEERPAVLRPGGPPLALAGRVVDVDGRPLRGLRVWTRDPTPFRGPKLPESDGYELTHQLPAERHPDELGTFAEALLVGEGAGWLATKTDAGGRFRLEGLDDRAYALSILDGKSLHRVDLDPTPAGREDLELVFAPAPAWPLVAGRVVDRRGLPVAGAAVRPMSCVLIVPAPDGDDRRTHVVGRAATTDARGAFLLRDVPPTATWLSVSGANVSPTGLDLAAEDPGRLAELELQVARLVPLQVLDALDADSFALLDVDGEALRLHRVEGGRRRVVRRARLEAGRSDVLEVPEEAATIVLYADDGERGRRSLVLDGAGLNVIRP